MQIRVHHNSSYPSAPVGAWPLSTASAAQHTAPADEFKASEASYPFAQDQDWQRAGQLMTEHGIALEGHSLMRENISTYLAHCPRGKTMPVGRWDNKLQKDLKAPYTDQEVFQRVDELQSSLLENLSQMTHYPKEIYLTGSFAKGRLRQQSDLNGYATVPKAEFMPEFHLFKTRFQEKKGAKIFPFSQSQPNFNKGMLMVDGASLKISTDKLGDKNYLRELYTDVLAQPKPRRYESTPKMDLWFGKAWRSKYERAPLHYRAMRLAVAMCGALTRLPVVGATAESWMSHAISQNHRDLTTA